MSEKKCNCNILHAANNNGRTSEDATPRLAGEEGKDAGCNGALAGPPLGAAAEATVVDIVSSETAPPSPSKVTCEGGSPTTTTPAAAPLTPSSICR